MSVNDRPNVTAQQRARKFHDLPDIGKPVEGYYAVHLARGGVEVGARIWFGPPLDPDTLEELDRAPRMNAMRNGQPCEIADIWPFCIRKPIDKAEYDHLIARYRWHKAHEPESPYANPQRPVDFNSAPLPF